MRNVGHKLLLTPPDFTLSGNVLQHDQRTRGSFFLFLKGGYAEPEDAMGMIPGPFKNNRLLIIIIALERLRPIRVLKRKEGRLPGRGTSLLMVFKKFSAAGLI